MNTTKDFKVGDTVLFGRQHGEKTLGEVIKINRKAMKVKTLESRGSKSPAGAVWNVPPSLCTLTDRTPRPGAAVSIVDRALDKLTAVEADALAAHFRQGYVPVSMF